MKIVASEPVLECTFEEFWREYWSKCSLGVGETQEDSETTLKGKSCINPKFRIPSADKKSDVFFDNREMLCRFANFPTPVQEHFLSTIRQAMVERKINQIVITIPWSEKTSRRLRIRSSGFDYSLLNFEVLR